MSKLYVILFSCTLWLAAGFVSAADAQSELIVNNDLLREYCTVTASGRSECHVVQSQYTRSVGAPTERCFTSASGHTRCEWTPAPLQSCLVLSSGRHVCETVDAGESSHSNENMICTDTPQGTSCVSRNPPTVPSCASVRCTSGTRCVETSTGPQCVADEPPTLTCANALCSVGNKCIETMTGPQCVPDTPRLSCANMLCVEGSKCEETATGPKCVADTPPFTPWDRRICPAVYDPVCGQKGHLKRTFGNDCEARRDHYDVLYKGVCRFSDSPPLGNVPCPANWDPVCGRKGNETRTLGNSCVATREGYEILYMGECGIELPSPPLSPEPTMCPMIYQPVCGKKGFETRTFSNDCVARGEGYAVISQGECGSGIVSPPPGRRPGICTREYRPVCGQRGFERKTFGNSCEAKANDYSVIYQGQCR